jgi:hypothetical protein
MNSWLPWPGKWVLALHRWTILPSYKPRNPKPIPKILDDDEAWEALVGDVYQHVKAIQASNRGKGQLKPFSIQIVDLPIRGQWEKGGGQKGKSYPRFSQHCRH